MIFLPQKILAGALVCFFCAVPLPAVTWTVTTVLDESDVPAGAELSLREAIRDAASGDTIDFAATLTGENLGGAIVLDDTLVVTDKDLTIDASGRDHAIRIEGRRIHQILRVEGSSVVTVKAVMLTEGIGAVVIDGAHVTLLGCTLFNNSVGASNGGAVMNKGAGTLVMQHCTVTENFARFGAGIHNTGSSTATLAHCTVVRNTAETAGGGVFNAPGSTLTLSNTIVAANEASGGRDVGNNGGTLNVVGNNVIGTNGSVASPFPAGTPNANGDIVGTAGNRVDPLLAPLGWYGGGVLTMHPQSGSPCIDAAEATIFTVDGRGFVRPVDGDFPGDAVATPDIGAVECGRARGVTITADENDGGLGLGSGDSLREVLDASVGSGDRVLFDAPLGGSECTLTLGRLALNNQELVLDASDLLSDAGSPGVSVGAGGAFQVFYLNQSQVGILGLEIEDGTDPGDGAGLEVRSSDLTLDHCVVKDNDSTSGNGGGLWGNLSRIRLLDCTFTGNAAIDGGAISGAAHVTGFAEFHLWGCTLSGNVAEDGAGIHVGSYSQLTAENCTISGNIAQFFGGGLRSANPSELRHCTVTENFAGVDGGGIYTSTLMTLWNAVVAGNTCIRDGADVFATTGVGAFGQNLIGNNDTVELKFPAGSLVGTDANPLDAKLSDLGDHGGATLTHALRSGSPARDAAGVSASDAQADMERARFDQRGLARIVGDGPDIGAHEAGSIVDYVLWALEEIPEGDEDGFEQDADDDILKNGLEYALGGSPRGPDSGILPVLVMQAAGGGGVEAVFTHRYQAAAHDVIYRVLSSPDMAAGFTEVARADFTVRPVSPVVTGAGVSVSDDVSHSMMQITDPNVGGGTSFWLLEVVYQP